MKKRIIFYIFLILFILPSFSFAEERAYTCYRLTKEPVLDGKLTDDPAWKSIPEATGRFVRLGTDIPASKQTSFKIGYGRDALYIGINCAEPEVGKITAKAKNDSLDICGEDSIEVFLSPQGTGNYYQFMINTIGSRWSALYGRMSLGVPTTISSGDWQAKTYRGKDYYSMEIKIPYEIFAAIPTEKTEWTGNICRNILTSGNDRYTTWAYMKGGFHEPDNFERIQFVGNLSAGEAKKANAKIINVQKKRLKAVFEAKAKEIAANLQLVALSKKEISQKTREYPSLQKESASLWKDYAEIKKALSRLDTMEKAGFLLQKSENLIERSRNLLNEADKFKREPLLQSFFD